ncbi:hypothetical protein EVAR_16385_1 [Eumeta japonica]|uniref:Uncharacterized protein n=1 Tax=Eumeta variegata TaxID=151549 RepID=A0A4C1VVQ8_EUMVA|nr:hypothetical protein EVAR_16385_1 [Eumeta japonica]
MLIFHFFVCASIAGLTRLLVGRVPVIDRAPRAAALLNIVHRPGHELRPDGKNVQSPLTTRRSMYGECRAMRDKYFVAKPSYKCRDTKEQVSNQTLMDIQNPRGVNHALPDSWEEMEYLLEKDQVNVRRRE